MFGLSNCSTVRRLPRLCQPDYPTQLGESGVPGPVIDCGIHHSFTSSAELLSYLPKRWQSYVGDNQIVPSVPYQRSGGEYVRSSFGSIRTGSPGADKELLSEWLDRESGQRALLVHESGRYLAGTPNHYLASALCRAANDWTAERWLDSTGKFRGTILAATQLPSDAAKEIRRWRSDDRMVAVLITHNGLNKPLGHPAYHPIYRAAADVGLPIVIHVGTDVLTETVTTPTAGGEPMLYSEYHALAAQSLMTHLVSLIGQGVFERFPSLRVVLYGAGSSWLPGLMWRFDAMFRAMSREVPWLRRFPSDYAADHVKLTTYPIEQAAGNRLEAVLRAFPALRRMLVFASGFPTWDADTPEAISQFLPAPWVREVLFDNAVGLFR
jgi:uncharacterized protein